MTFTNLIANIDLYCLLSGVIVINKIFTDGQRLIDELSRERVFNGINIVDKRDYEPGRQKFFFDADDAFFKQLSECGVNLIRLGFCWANIEPAPHKYNDEYITDVLGGILDICEKYGIYAYLDMHQDTYSSTCNNDGAPAWATITDKYKVRPVHFVWAEAYFWGKYCHRAFDNFWSNRFVSGKGLQDYYADCWNHIVSLIGKKPAVIGFDLMNEPFPGTDGGKCFRLIVKNGIKALLFDPEFKRAGLIKDVFSSERVPRVLNRITYGLMRRVTSACDDITRKFDTEKYAPFLEKTARGVRAASKDKIFFIENSFFSNAGIPCSVPPIKTDGKIDENQAFAPHAYDMMVDTPMYKYASFERVNGMFSAHRDTQLRLNVPVVVGEWGGFGGGGDEGWLPHIAAILKLFDSYKWSNTYWCCTGKDIFNSPLMKVFIRPYPRAVPGTIKEYSYDLEKKVFELSFSQSENSLGGTVICTPKKIDSVTVDGKETKYTVKNNEITIGTKKGEHKITVKFIEE